MQAWWALQAAQNPVFLKESLGFRVPGALELTGS